MKSKIKSLPEDIIIHIEASYRQFPETPSHSSFQMTIGLLLTELIRRNVIVFVYDMAVPIVKNKEAGNLLEITPKRGQSVSVIST